MKNLVNLNKLTDLRSTLLSFLNLHIGDEELYLENNTLPYRAQYEVEYDIHLNERNRYYEYARVPTTAQTLLGVYSKRDVYAITNTGFATFIYDVTTGLPLNHLGFYGTTTSDFAQINQPLNNCCVNYIGFKGTTAPIYKIDLPITLSENYLKVSPNPNKGDLLTLKYQFKNVGNIQFSIVDAMGKQLYTAALFILVSKQQITTVFDISKLKLPAGLYFIRLANGKEILSSKLIVTN